AFGEELSQGAAARTTFRVKGSKSSRKKACSQELAAKEGIGRGSGEIRDSYRSPTADPRGAPKTQVFTAPAPAAREHGRRCFHLDPLVFVGPPPLPKVAICTPSTHAPVPNSCAKGHTQFCLTAQQH